MKKSRFTESQIVGVLKQVDAGAKVEDVCGRQPHWAFEVSSVHPASKANVEK